MINSIKIKNFKAISEEGIRLSKLCNINFIVGKNGSGKSSILEAIYLLKQNQLIDFDIQKYNILGFKYSLSFPENVTSEFTFDFGENYSVRLFKEPRNQFLQFLHSDSYPKNTATICPIVYEFKDIEIKGEEASFYFHEMNQFFKSIEIDFLETFLGYEFTEIGENGTNFKYSSDRFLEFFNSKNLNESIANSKFNNLSSGKIELLKFCIKIYDCIRANSSFINKKELNIPERVFEYIKTSPKTFVKNLSSNLTTVILIEEPENYLHPELQKKIPWILSKISKILTNSVQFFITTHSPFIISAAAKEEQKLYIIDNGICINEFGSKNGGFKRQAIEMIGAGQEDLLPKNIVFCEGEVRSGWESKPNFQHDAKIYNYLFEDISDVAFYSGGGKSDLEKVGSHLTGLFSMFTINTTYIVFCDSDYLTEHETTLQKKYPAPYQKRSTGPNFNNLESILYHKSVLMDLGLPEFTIDEQKKDRHADTYFSKNFSKIEILDDYFKSVTNRSFWKSYFEYNILAPIIKKMSFEERNESNLSLFWQLYDSIFNQQIHG